MITRIIAEQNRDLQLVGAKDNIQIQMANDEQDAYINVNRSEAKLLAAALIKHCREDEKPNPVSTVGCTCTECANERAFTNKVGWCFCHDCGHEWELLSTKKD